MTRVIVKLLGWSWVALAIFLLDTPERVRMGVRVYVLSSLIPIGMGWYQWVHYKIFGTIARLPIESFALSQSEAAAGIRYSSFLRPNATFLEPNYYAYFLGSVSLILLGQLVTSEGLLGRIFAKILFVLTILQLALTLSLSGIIGTLAGVFAFILLVPWKSIRIIAIVVPLAVVVGLVPAVRPIVTQLTTKVYVRSSQADTLFGRDQFLSGVPKALVQSGGLGIGFGGLSSVTHESISTAHSALLTVLAEQGIFAFVTMVTWMALVLMILARRVIALNGNMFINLALFASLLSILVGNLAYDGMYSFDSAWVLLGLSGAAAALNSGAGGRTS